MHYIALDIETCPLPLEGYSAQQQARLAREMQFRRQREPDMPEDMLAHWAASLHPLLSRIVCISVQRAENDPLQPNPPHSYLATEPAEERRILQQFWQDLQRVVERGEKICWVTFNGKRFDVPFLLARTLHHGLKPITCGLPDDYPYRQYPHCDLFNLFSGINWGLEDLCALLHIPNPKAHGDGSLIAQILETEGVDGVRRYCEADVKATLACFAKLLPLLPPECQPH